MPDDSDSEAFADLKYPIVALADAGSRNLVDTLSMDNYNASRAATVHLLERGRNEIAIVGADIEDAQRYRDDRVRGHFSALAAHGLEQDKRLIRKLDVWDRDGGYEATRDLVEAGVSFSAVRYLNDGLALGGLRALRDTGYSVPADVAVIGFDDLDEAELSTPTLSSVSAGRRELAKLAIASLNEQIEQRNTGREPKNFVMKYEVQVRESSSF